MNYNDDLERGAALATKFLAEYRERHPLTLDDHIHAHAAQARADLERHPLTQEIRAHAAQARADLSRRRY